MGSPTAPSPPPLEKLNPESSPGAGQVIARALMKAPDDRYPDAGAMLRDLERLLRGEPTSIPMHPRLPPHDPRRMLRFEFTWDLDSSPAQLWPHVTNTDRLDRAIGFAPVKYTTSFEPGRGVRRFAEGRKAGMVEKGEEFPYEWVEPQLSESSLFESTCFFVMPSQGNLIGPSKYMRG